MRGLRAIAGAAALVLAGTLTASGQDPRRITVLYDAFGPPSSLVKDWGFAALVEYRGRRVLFDTGNNAGIFEQNTKELGIDLTRLDAVVISHRHGDHTSGLTHLLKVNPGVRIYTPQEGAFFKGQAPSGFLERYPGLPPNLQYLRRQAAGSMGVGNSVGDWQFRDRDAVEGNPSRLPCPDHTIAEAGNARDERSVAGVSDAAGSCGHRRMLPPGRREDPRRRRPGSTGVCTW